MEVIPNGSIGAEVRGVDLAGASAREINEIKQAWYRHDVVVFRRQKLTDDDLLAFSRHFGTLDPKCREKARRSSSVSFCLRNTTTSWRYHACLISLISLALAPARSTPLTS